MLLDVRTYTKIREIKTTAKDPSRKTRIFNTTKIKTLYSTFGFLVCWGWVTSYIVLVHIQYQASIYALRCVAGIHGGCSKPSWRRWLLPGTWSHLWFVGYVNVQRGALLLVNSDSTSVLLYFTFLSYLFPLLFGAGSTVPREGFDSSIIMPFSCVLWLWHFLYSVCPYKVSSLHIYPLLFHGHSWRVRLAKQETLTPPRAPRLTSGLEGSVYIHLGALLLVPQWQCISSFVFYTIEFSDLWARWDFLCTFIGRVWKGWYDGVYP